MSENDPLRTWTAGVNIEQVDKWSHYLLADPHELGTLS
jgi:hypothetical protein